jgi:hypothetical protein
MQWTRKRSVNNSIHVAMPNQNPRKPFPAWRLPKGMITANDEALEESIESCETWEWYGGGLVVIGVFAAVAIAAWHPLYNSWLEQWGSAISDSLVAVGVVVEIRFGQMAGLRHNELRRRSDEKVSEANERAAEAIKKANEAALELERLRSPRSLNRDQLYRAVDKLKQFAPMPFDASVNPGNPEFVSCLRCIEVMLMLADWKQVDWNGSGMSMGRESTGLPRYGMASSVSNVSVFFLVEEDSSMMVAASALADALKAEGIVAEARPVSAIDDFGIPKPKLIHIAVGTKT